MPKHMSAPAARVSGLRYAGALASAAALTLTAACGGSGDGGDGDQGGGNDLPEPPEVSADSELADNVPEDMREKGTIKIGVDTTYAPGEFLAEDGETIVGFNIQLFDAVAAKLDLETEWESSTFGTIVEGVDTGKYDAGVSSFTINNQRLEQVNMVSYYNAGTQWFAAKGNPEGITPDDACGANIAVQKDTVQVPDIKNRSEQCEEDGEPAININQYKGQDQATQSITSGKNDAGLADMPVAMYAVEQTDGELETVGEQYEADPYGAVVNKDDDELAQSVADGYQAIMDDGTYEEILSNWGLDEQGMLDQARVNPDVDSESDE
ncbi:amino acid ABC transporter substrate-binding protein (PAAT family) [Haloactinospora alba]|uniref:Amino acid ABC transporter substrate-binding protein (PAAT family) n=2 Tax=Haloactinospora alba TaxID=405555 RepID=A0A543NFB8_9ACTN|nr:amino acid ABC transporter substrate-binding protein (PAAT family) [Haloactinospora alba]